MIKNLLANFNIFKDRDWCKSGNIRVLILALSLIDDMA